MRVLGVGLQIAKRHCCCSNQCDPLPPCPPKPWRKCCVILYSLVTFGAGVYTGMYVSQNYEVPQVESPKALVESANQKIRELIDGKKKTPVEQIVHDIKKEAKKVLDD